MLRGEKVTLRAVEKEEQETLWRFCNDLEVELAGGGDPPLPVSLERLRARFEREEREGTRDKTDFMIEVDGASIGHCASSTPMWRPVAASLASPSAKSTTGAAATGAKPSICFSTTRFGSGT